MDAERLCRTLDAVEREAERRFAGDEPDRRFDLVIDVVGDLGDELEKDGAS